MRLLAVITSLIWTAVSAAEAQDLRTFTEPRFGTSAQVPAGWRSQTIEREAGVSGRYFYSKDGATWIAVFGRTVSAGVSPRSSANAPDERVTYRADGPRWFVRSGLREDRIFYRKALLSCGGRVAHLIAFEYPADRKLEHDRLVTLVSRSLRAERNLDC